MLDGSSSPWEDEFLKQLEETGATESSCVSNIPSQVDEIRQAVGERTKKILSNVISGINDLWYLKGGLYASAQHPEGDETCNVIVLDVRDHYNFLLNFTTCYSLLQVSAG